MQTARIWQQSSGESNFSPIKAVPQIRVNASPNVTNALEPPHKVLDTRIDLSPEKFLSLTYHERLYLSGRATPNAVPKIDTSSPVPERFSDHRLALHLSPINKVRPLTEDSRRTANASPEKQRSDLKKMSNLCFAHESISTMAPQKQHLKAYHEGIDVHAPLTIVMHQKRGVKLPKISPDRATNSMSRNHHGGFYSAIA